MAYLEGLLQEARPEVAIDHFGDLGHSQHPKQADRLDSNLTANVARGAATSATTTTVQPHRVSGNTPISVISDVRSTEPHENDLLSNEVALLCLGAAGREPQYFGPSSAVHFSRIVSSTLRLPRRGGTGSHYSNTSDSGTCRVTARYQGFPNAAMMAKLSEAYFSNIHPQYPFLHQPTFRAMEQECLEASLRNNINAASESSLFFVLMVRHILFFVPL